jgi:hypothetical protein
MKALKFVTRFCLLSLFSFTSAQASIYLTANFDDLTEGFQGDSFSDGGILFSNLDERFQNEPAYGVFAIQATTADLPGFSPPNYLTFEGFGQGDTAGYSFGRFGSANIGFSGIASFASMDIFGFATTSMNTLTLDAMLGSSVVESDTVTFYSANPSGVVYLPMSVSGTFDSLQLVAAGSDNNGTDFFGMDNVNITIVPEEPVGVLVCCGLIGLFAFQCAKRTRRFSTEVDAA